jgi:arachidonate 15-lipoxygenase (second type) / 8-lipoxygenase (S-type)
VTPQLFSYRQIALAVLVNPGGQVDQLFSYSGAAAAQMTSDLYNSGEAGSFQANYLYNNLKSRGLINSNFGPEIRSFPYFEDASVIHTSIQNFVSSFVDSYYTDSSEYYNDAELQAWIAEAVPAQTKDFPTKIDRDTLIDILNHVSFLGSAEHHTLNTNDTSEASESLPFHPFSLYQPIPTEKGVADLKPFLPNVTQSVGQISLTASFARPSFVNSSLTLKEMFNDQVMLGRMNGQTTEAATRFQNEMLALSDVVSSRTFDADGLSQGMPFIWKALDPQRALYYLTI